MLLQREQLEDMNITQLKGLAYEIGMELDNPSEPKPSLINRLMVESAKEVPPVAPETPLADVEQRPAPLCTIDEIKRAVNAEILKGMELFHNKDDQTWYMRIKIRPLTMRDSNTGEIKTIPRYRDDSGTLHQPLATIRLCARTLMSGISMVAETKPMADPAKHYESVS
jgi:hypothetical protein